MGYVEPFRNGLFFLLLLNIVVNRFAQSKNPVYLFCLSDSYGTLVDVSYFPPFPLPSSTFPTTNTLSE
jgi:hypothetical protein